MDTIIDFLNSNVGAITILISFVVALYKFVQYINIKIHESREKRFQHYHNDLIKKLVEPDSPGKDMKMDRQIAIIYELRNFPEYFSVSIRILQGWIIADDKIPERMRNEAKLAVSYMKKGIIGRFISRLVTIITGC